jgi:pyruvate-formate lyase-activating enzyme
MTRDARLARALDAERVASTPKHWVRLGTACNSNCVFCLDGDAERNVLLDAELVRAEIRHGLEEGGARRLVLSGGEPTIHPAFTELVRFAKAAGYEWVQTITNGSRFAERVFYEECVEAGLDEVTFSLHGDTAALHDSLTRVPGSFARLTKGLLRCTRGGRVIVSVDIVMCRENIAHVEGVVELCLSLGVREFDLLHLIPHGRAYRARERLFYDPAECLGRLHRVLRLNRHRACHVWTNRLPPQYLEGFEDLIQDPNKLHDEAEGREPLLRRYLDSGVPLPCRAADRCPHCYLSPFCATLDVVLARLGSAGWDVLRLEPGGRPQDGREPLPFGCRHLAVEVEGLGELASLRLPPGAGLVARVRECTPLERVALPDAPLRLVAGKGAQIDAWLAAPLPAGVTVEVELNRDTAGWLLENRDALGGLAGVLAIHQPGRATLHAAVAENARDLRGLFSALPRLRVSGVPPCLAPGSSIVGAPRALPARLFDRHTGRLDLGALVEYHVRERYAVQSARCRSCSLAEVCPGLPIQTVRAEGLRLAEPLAETAWSVEARHGLASAAEERRLSAVGNSPPQPAAPLLPAAWRPFGRSGRPPAARPVR